MDGPLRPVEPFEIKVYEIDDVERLQRRREKGKVRGGGGMEGGRGGEIGRASCRERV